MSRPDPAPRRLLVAYGYFPEIDPEGVPVPTVEWSGGWGEDGRLYACRRTGAGDDEWFAIAADHGVFDLTPEALARAGERTAAPGGRVRPIRFGAGGTRARPCVLGVSAPRARASVGVRA